MNADANATIALSLISHTNVGKTTLARTLLGKDVGTVRDAQHVTLEAASYPLIPDSELERLEDDYVTATSRVGLIAKKRNCAFPQQM